MGKKLKNLLNIAAGVGLSSKILIVGAVTYITIVAVMGGLIIIGVIPVRQNRVSNYSAEQSLSGLKKAPPQYP